MYLFFNKKNLLDFFVMISKNMKKPLLILISGHIATGKTTLGQKISEKFSLPIVSPDEIKETIWDNMGWEHDRKEWHALGKASFELMYYFVETTLSKNRSVIAEAHFHPEINNKRINKLKKKYSCEILQINCKTKKENLIRRLKKRIKSDDYHPGHRHGLSIVYTEKEFLAKLGKENRLLDINGETIKINTTNPENINYDKIFKFIVRQQKCQRIP